MQGRTAPIPANVDAVVRFSNQSFSNTDLSFCLSFFFRVRHDTFYSPGVLLLPQTQNIPNVEWNKMNRHFDSHN
jgi:hypothetical protein